MTKRRFCFTFFLLICFSLPLTVTAQTVNIPDDNLRAIIENALGKAPGDTITAAEMEIFTIANLANANIRNLTGLEYAINLTKLNLGPVWEGESVRQSNILSDISPIGGLINLEELKLGFTFISDISPIEALTNLTHLELWGNLISDISPLEGLTDLTYLDLSFNFISDISPLVANTGLGSGGLFGDLISVEANPLSYASLHTHIPELERRGATVFFDPRTPVLRKISGVVTESSDSTLIVEVRDSENEQFEGVPVTFTVTSGGGTLSLINTTTDENGRAESVLTPGTDGVNSVEVSAAGAAQKVTFTQVVVSVVNIHDANLRAKIEEALGKASGDTITTVDMETLTELRAPNADITDLTGLESATNLRTLDLGDERVDGRWMNSNSISDISPLVHLTILEELDLDRNAISNISPLAGLTNLTVLLMEGNSISDISPIAGLTNLTWLFLDYNSISNISPVEGLTNLTHLRLSNNSILNISAVEELNQLTELSLWNNSISDISPLAGLTNLETLGLDQNSISDISPLEGLTNLTLLGLAGNNISDISAVEGLNQLTSLFLNINSIADISPLVANTGLGTGDRVRLEGNPLNAASINDHIPALQSRGVEVLFDAVVAEPVVILDDNLRAAIADALGKASGDAITTMDMEALTELGASDADVTNLTGLEAATNLTQLSLGFNAISDISPVAGLTNLTELSLDVNSISDISPLVGLTNLTDLDLSSNPISDISPIAGLTNLKYLVLSDTPISDISPLAGLTNLTDLDLWGSAVSDLSPLAANMGLGEGDWVDVTENPLSQESINDHIPTLRSKGVEVRADNLKPTTSEFALSIPAGVHAIHIPLAVNRINGEDGSIETVGDLYNAFGDAVRYIITLGADGNWISYLGGVSAGSMADAPIKDDTGLIAVMKEPKTLELMGDALGTAGTSRINLLPGNNLVGIPLDTEGMISGLLVKGVGAVAVSNAAGDGFNTISKGNLAADGPMIGGVGYIVVATGETSISIEGTAWENTGAAMAAPAVAFSGSQTPVLYVEGGVMHEFGMLAQVPELRVTVKNLSTGALLDTVLGSEASYSATFVEFGHHAAKAGDVLEIVARSPNPYVGVRPVPQIVVSAEEVLTSRISLPDLELYEIPAETELLRNYPNPFNPETWIPYRLAKAAEVTLAIYDTNGALVRSIDVGFKPAAVYESRASAIYWDGRNNYGERVASGTYFYHLSTGTYSATRKMVIVK